MHRFAIALPIFVALLLAGCGSSVPASHEHPEPLSASEHEQHAQAHEAQAESSTERVDPEAVGANQVECVDTGGPMHSGGERIPVMKPCWTGAEQNASYLRAASAHREAAADHREWAQKLVDAELEFCQELGEIERSTSPFVRGPDILSVEAYNEGKTLRGARVTFRKVSGLSKDFLIKSIKCHQARAATLGYSRDFMPHCPLALAHTGTSVTENANTVVVTLRSEDPIVATQLYGRAMHAAEDEAAAP